MSTAPQPPPAAGEDLAALRKEHDALAAELEVRPSVDHARRGFYQAFAGLIAMGLTIKLGWDRWGVLKPGLIRKFRGPPVFMYAALAVTAVLLVLAIRSFLITRRLRRGEDARFARYRALRARLGLDP